MVSLKPFQRLTPRGHLGRLQRLARTALDAYDLSEPQVVPLRHGLDASFQVGAGGRRYLLRVLHPRSRSLEAIRSELHWTDALHRDAAIGVPRAVPARDGARVQIVTAPDFPEPHSCSLFEWVDGEFVDNPGRREMQLAGCLTATMHAHAASWQPPEDFVRPRWDITGLLGGVIGVAPEQCIAPLSAHERAVAQRCAERVGFAMGALGESRDLWGMIHADIHHGNYRFHDAGIRIIDFKNCGWGHYLYDIAVVFSTLPDHGSMALRQSFLQGYRQVRQLPIDYEAYFDVFLAGRILWRALLIAANIDEMPFREHGRYMVAREMARLEKLLKEVSCQTKRTGAS